MQEKFHNCINTAIKKRPFNTKYGQVQKDMIDFELGCPIAPHQIDGLWVYQRKKTNLEMVFGFYDNFSPHDLICKIVEQDYRPKTRKGASVQFNANDSLQREGKDIALIHHGLITVRIRIGRDKLLSHIKDCCPHEMKLAKISGEWPIRIGSTNDIDSLIDQMFIYAYCIEQAKRSIREEPLFPLLS